MGIYIYNDSMISHITGPQLLVCIKLVYIYIYNRCNIIKYVIYYEPPLYMYIISGWWF